MCNCDRKRPDGEADLYPPFNIVLGRALNDIERILDDIENVANGRPEVVSVPPPITPATTATENVLCDIFDERAYQDQKWGQQNHPDGTHIYYEYEQGIAKARMAEAVKYGHVTWTHILLEEVFEAVSETHPDKLRAELVQVASVACAWAEAIDRRHETVTANQTKGETHGR